jgi:hypothetical protein
MIGDRSAAGTAPVVTVAAPLSAPPASAALAPVVAPATATVATSAPAPAAAEATPAPVAASGVVAPLATAALDKPLPVRPNKATPRPQPRAEGAAPVAQEQPVAVAPAPPPAAPAVQNDGPATPKQACGGRVFLALALCMEEQCERPRYKSHPQCRKVHDLLERRRRGESGD